MKTEPDVSSAAVDPNALHYQEIMFSLVMGVLAVLGRENNRDLLLTFVAMLAFNLSYHRLLRSRGGTVVPLVSMAVNVTLCSLVVALSGGHRSSFWPLYL